MTVPNWQNRTLFHGDNLKFMRAMNSESVDLIATDPPFNKGRDFHATPDSLAAGASFQDRWSWERDVHQDWVDQLTDDHPKLIEAIESARYSHSDSMGAYVCFMAVRLLAMHRLLKPTGSIYLHCDPTASHYLKAVMDAIFGWKQFRNEVVWCYKSRPQPKRYFGMKHDLILFYSKTDDYQFNYLDVMRPLSKATVKKYKHVDENGRKYRLQGRGITGSPIRSAKDVDPRWEQERPELVVRDYLDEKKGVVLEDWWTDIGILNQMARERTGYPTQKPPVLYERIIKAGKISGGGGGVVLDPFAGCATTLVAAEKLGCQWVGIDIWDKALEVIIKRLEDESLLGGFKIGDIDFTKELPVRTDDGDTAAPFLRVKKRVHEPAGPKMSRKQMYEYLLDQHGPVCQGCDRSFDDARYLELDHNTPRSDGGVNHISNRILLCGPCNKLKSNQYTLSGLRRQNKQRGYMR